MIFPPCLAWVLPPFPEHQVISAGHLYSALSTNGVKAYPSSYFGLVWHLGPNLTSPSGFRSYASNLVLFFSDLTCSAALGQDQLNPTALLSYRTVSRSQKNNGHLVYAVW